jgi:hypothetical protein
MTASQVCHVKVMEVAKAAAGELYESMMGNDAFFKAWKKQNPGANPKQLERRFIEKNWGSCLEFARATLTVMLTRHDVAEELKEEIMVILEQDQTLRNRRVTNPPFRPIH